MEYRRAINLLPEDSRLIKQKGDEVVTLFHSTNSTSTTRSIVLKFEMFVHLKKFLKIID